MDYLTPKIGLWDMDILESAWMSQKNEAHEKAIREHSEIEWPSENFGIIPTNEELESQGSVWELLG